MKKQDLILGILFAITGVLYFILTAPQVTIIEAKVIQVTDGDTLILEGGQKVRLKGINTPETGQSFYNEAKLFLQNQTLNKVVELHAFETDRYNRTLGYIFVEGDNMNEEILRQGLGHLYYYGTDSYYDDLKSAENFAINSGLGIWKVSPFAGCLKLIELKYYEDGDRCSNSEKLVIENTCQKTFAITIKDDATHLYKGNIEPKSTFEKNFSCIFNDAGDSLYIRDQEYLLMFYRY